MYTLPSPGTDKFQSYSLFQAMPEALQVCQSCTHDFKPIYTETLTQKLATSGNNSIAAVCAGDELATFYAGFIDGDSCVPYCRTAYVL